MVEYTLINYALRKCGYSFWKLNETEYIITKNEYGTYGEHYDFEIHFSLEENTSVVKKWDIKSDGRQVLSKNYIEQMKVQLVEIINDTNTKILDDICIAIANKLQIPV